MIFFGCCFIDTFNTHLFVGFKTDVIGDVIMHDVVITISVCVRALFFFSEDLRQRNVLSFVPFTET